jgi:hypothetical protein
MMLRITPEMSASIRRSASAMTEGRRVFPDAEPDGQ